MSHPRAAVSDRAAPRAGFTLVELVIAVIILAIGVLGLAGTTMLVVRQVTLADVNTERSAALQTVIERLRATSTSSISTGNQTIGSYAVTWSVTDSTTLSKTVRVITRGPGLRRDTAAVVPMLGANVADTFTLVVLKL
jgi:prepilin-type N-terminal cleavage/methylation domain-containing protein